MFHYTGCGLRNVWLTNGYKERETSFGKSVAIHDLEGLHKAIGLNIACRKPNLTGGDIRFLRKELDMSQIDLARILGVPEPTIRNWENNRNRITRSAERMLRALYYENVKGNVKVRKLLEALGQLSRNSYRAEIRLQETEEGWREAA